MIAETLCFRFCYKGSMFFFICNNVVYISLLF
nr:MAG TPA_asm: hypothetical protein [Caudoviricetes sp.]